LVTTACGLAGEPTHILNLNKQVKAGRGLLLEDVGPLIIGGDAAGPDEFPWMAVIAKKRIFGGNHKIICGGSGTFRNISRFT